MIAALIIALISIVLMLLVLYISRARRLSMQKQLSDMRDSFFSNVSHESRTPLTVIIGLSHDIQEDSSVSEATKEKAKSIERQGRRILALVNQILDVSKVKSAMGDPEWQNSDMIPFLAQIVNSYRPYADSRGIALRFINYGQSSVMMDFIPDYVAKVMNNLLSNAFKYTPEGGCIEVSAIGSGKVLKINVSDSGAGIRKDALEHIFEPYYQSSSGMRAVGTGIGLTLVKQIIDNVKGEISVESTLGTGTVFHVRVPIRNECKACGQNTFTLESPLLPDADDIIASGGKVEAADDDETRVLVVDDNRDIAEYIGMELPDTYSVYYAKNGEEGLMRTIELTPDIVITDWMMPKMSGIELCKAIRSNGIVNHIPIVMLTARTLQEDRVEGAKAGAEAFLSKPFDSEELIAVVENLMEGRRIMREKYWSGNTIIRTSGEKQNPEEEFLDKVSTAVKRRIGKSEKIDVPQIAFDLSMSRSQLYRKFKSISGTSPLEFFQQIRVDMARELICSNPDVPLSEVCDGCGFNDYSSFFRAFKTVLGQTPSEFRDKCLAMHAEGCGE